ncbi:esterase/lipase family protein [Desulfocurvus sp. DL9XJH121]
MQKPFYPIVYIRGYAMTMDAVEDTVADPYMGFNKGSTKIRQQWTGDVERHYFESPLIRLMKDHGYRDVYENGAVIPDSQTPPDKSIWIFRYYDKSSKDFGDGKKHPIESYAEDLDAFIEKLFARYGKDPAFRVHLVAHSMGGLVARCYMQKIAPARAAKRVEKFFTYATPHNGIDLLGGWINAPDWGWLNVKNFNRENMCQYLGLPKGTKKVNTLNGKFPEERCFCLVGTDYKDYSLARFAVGEMSDGLVRIENATLQGVARAFVHRSHSGHYGIVNSESGYQNLRRFLFGRVRVEALLQVKGLPLPAAVEKQKSKGIKASYHMDVVASVRKAQWNLHRRTTRECSALFGKYDDMVKQQKPLHLATAFLMEQPNRTAKQGLSFSLELKILVPDYVIDGIIFDKHHYETAPLFADTYLLEAVSGGAKGPLLRWGLHSKTPSTLTRTATGTPVAKGVLEYRLPVVKNTRPGIDAELILRASDWS